MKELLPKKWKDWAMNKRVNLKKQSPFLMDFENYTIGRLVPGRSNYDYKNKEYKKVCAQLQWRVEQLGWSYEKFAKIEESIQNWHRYERRINEKLKTDRYGKKYSWIAYYEMHGFLRDRGVLDNYDWRRSDTQNIDPSFCEPMPSQILVEKKFLGDDKATTPAWIKDGDLPDISTYLYRQKIGEEDGPWIALDGYVSQENKDLHRKTFFFVRSFLVSTNEKDEILDFLNKQDMSNSWAPEKLEFPKTFFAEVPWSSTYSADSSCDLSFPIARRMITRQRPKIEIVRDGQNISIITHDELEKYEEEEIKYKTFKAIMPVCNLKQDVTDSQVGEISSLVQKLAIDMELVSQPQSFDLYTKCGKRSACYISHTGKKYNDKHSMYYLKEDLLVNFMNKNELSLIWVVWGERGYSISGHHVSYDNLPSPSYVVFGDAKEYCAEA